ncbi:MAG: hypothetical protein GWN71_06865 [Gammaproteobacteria bacterium]|nr:hypothetical protein [Gemmatimonadota bacterium]NIR35553.1 hypothetical protein [Actinomycetota bacterium]NIU73302.1 hypothetical protein [Gammaproteobacteria bacterium]NIY07741.1 hypothetical protein [Gemmatimonadota bacterium]
MPENDRPDPQLEALLRSLDHDPPRVTAADLVARAERRSGWGRWAAGVALALGIAGAAYAVPGSPVRGWIDGIAPGSGAGESHEVDAPIDRTGPAEGGAGVGLDPAMPLVVAFPSPRGGRLRVVLTGDSLVEVVADAGAARYTSEPGRLVVDPAGPAAFELRVPRTAVRVEVVIDGRRAFLKDGPETAAAVAPGPDGAYLLSLDTPM